MKLYGFWRSLAAYRVRVALNLKRLPYVEESVNLLGGAQHDPAYLAVNPQGAVPALVLEDGTILTQSMAIMEYLDERWPQPNALLPTDAPGRARVRSLAHLVVSDSHPLVVPRIRHFLNKELALGDEKTMQWLKHWSHQSLRLINARLLADKTSGRFCHGDAVSMADIALASQVIGSTEFFGCQLGDYPAVQSVYESLRVLDAFARAHPLAQAGAPAAL